MKKPWPCHEGEHDFRPEIDDDGINRVEIWGPDRVCFRCEWTAREVGANLGKEIA
jgi:hypothetical protein